MSILDTLLLAHLALLCLLASTPFDNKLYAVSEMVLISLPLIVFLSYHTWNLLIKCLISLKKCKKCSHTETNIVTVDSSVADEEQQHLLFPS